MPPSGWPLALFLLAVGSAQADWKRIRRDRPTEAWDTPEAQTLEYFRRDPCLRPDPRNRPGRCSTLGRIVRSDLRIAGRADGFTIYDLQYFAADKQRPVLRSVLVRAGSESKMHEVHIQDNSGGSFFPTAILFAGEDCLIRVKYDDGGSYAFVYEDYFILGRDGAQLLDFEPVYQAANRAPPSDKVTYQPTSLFDFNNLVFYIGTEPLHLTIGEKAACCQGRVEAPFRIVHGTVAAGQARYDPDWRPSWAGK